MQPVKIGFLSVYSGVFPNLNHQIVEGFVLPFAKDFKGERHFEFIPEYVQQGSARAVGEAVKKLIHFHNVDIVSGLISYQVVPQLIPLIESRQTLGFFLDLGEYLPSGKILSPNVFYNSFQLWQAEFALGYWAHKEFGDKGMVLMPMYEAGYQMHSAFRLGTVSAGSEAIDYHLLPYLEGQSQASYHVDHLLQTLEQALPAYLHVLFSGTEATEFLAKFYSSGLQNKIPLLVSPLMTQQDWLTPMAHLGGQFYAASTWNPGSSEKANQSFVKQYTSYTGKAPGVYELLGYEMGLLFKEILTEFRTRDWPAVRKLLQHEVLDGPRGLVNFWPQSGFITPTIAIEKTIFDSKNTTSVVVSGGSGVLYDSPAFDSIHEECKSGWQNPYLCV
jgi:branched-chain amino acid transport system substrate-binding protein